MNEFKLYVRASEANRRFLEATEELHKARMKRIHRVAEHLRSIQSEIEKALGFEVILVNVPNFNHHHGGVFVEVLGCAPVVRRKYPTVEEVNNKFREFLQERYRVPVSIARELVIVDGIAPQVCPRREECEDYEECLMIYG